MSATDDVKDLARKGVWTAPWPSRAAMQRRLPVLPPASPPASEGGVRNLSHGTEATSAQPPAALALLVGNNVLNPCGHRPRCANLMHVGPPVAVDFLMVLPTLQPGPAPLHPLSCLTCPGTSHS